jgi:type VI secretion system protein ImpM
MTQPAVVPLTYFGKLPSRGDFVRSANQATLVQTLDRWLSQGVELMTTDARWKEVYDRAPSAHFAFLGVRSTMGMAGHLIASADSSGRRFPFVTAGTFAVDAPLEFIARSPLALAPLWTRFAQAARQAHASEDAGALLGEIAQLSAEVHTAGSAEHDAPWRDFQDMHTVGSIDALLSDAGHEVDVRQSVLAVGLLLQPVLASASNELEKGLRLPLPADPLYQPLVATFWAELIAPFLQRGDLELGIFLPQGPGLAPALAIGFAGGSPVSLYALLDPAVGDELFVDLAQSQWVEDFAQEDYAVKKLSSYLQQPQLSLRQAIATFREAFLGS